MLFKLAWRNIWRNKRRSLITAASVTFALFFAICMRSMQLGTYDNVYNNVINSSTGYLQIHSKGYWDERSLEKSLELTDTLLEEIYSTKGVADIVPRLESFSLLSTGNDTKGALIMGVIPAKEQQYFNMDENLYEGNVFAEDEGQLLIAEGLAGYFDIASGDTIVMIGQGYHGVSANGQYPIKGIVKIKTPDLNNSLTYMPLKEAQFLYGAENRVSSLVIVPEDPENFEEVKDNLAANLDTAQYEIMTWREMMPELIQAMEADSAGGLIILFILYLVISFGVFGTILMLTAERIPEFGILISIGMSRWRIALITYLETIFLSLIGLIAGGVFALPLTYYYHYNPIKLTGAMDDAMTEYGFEPLIPASIDPSITLVHGTGVLIITMLLGLYAVWIIYRLNPVNAMRR